jgi:LemA protein
MRRTTLAIIAVLAVLIVGGGSCAYNRLVTLDQRVQAQWGQVQNVYQRRADLVPNLVQTVKGAAAFEKDTFTQVAAARSRAEAAPKDPAQLAQFQAAQDQLGSALGRLMVVAERYPDLHATQAFRDLQAQLEGTENRIAVERMRFNEAAREFNTARARFPIVLFANLFGGKFATKPYFAAPPKMTAAPEVKF